MFLYIYNNNIYNREEPACDSQELLRNPSVYVYISFLWLYRAIKLGTLKTHPYTLSVYMTLYPQVHEKPHP